MLPYNKLPLNNTKLYRLLSLYEDLHSPVYSGHLEHICWNTPRFIDALFGVTEISG